MGKSPMTNEWKKARRDALYIFCHEIIKTRSKGNRMADFLLISAVSGFWTLKMPKERESIMSASFRFIRSTAYPLIRSFIRKHGSAREGERFIFMPMGRRPDSARLCQCEPMQPMFFNMEIAIVGIMNSIIHDLCIFSICEGCCGIPTPSRKSLRQ